MANSNDNLISVSRRDCANLAGDLRKLSGLFDNLSYIAQRLENSDERNALMGVVEIGDSIVKANVQMIYTDAFAEPS